MKGSFIIAVDQSTTGTKVLLIDRSGNIVCKSYCEHRQIMPAAGYVEHDPLELLDNVKKLIRSVIVKSGICAENICCIAITNQRETVIAWDKATGQPVYNAIVWQCNRAGKQCEHIRSIGLEETVAGKTGLPLSEFFSAAKLNWIIDNVKEAAEKKKNHTLICGTVDSWLVWNLSEEKNHVTDYSNASRMQLLDLHTLSWDKEIVKAFSLDLDMLPDIVFSDTVVGHMRIDGVSVPIAGLIGDSHGALFAQSGTGTALKVTYGTGSSIMMGTGSKLVHCGKLATTVAYAYNGNVNFAVEGNVNSTGATIKWTADKLGLLPSAAEAEQIALDAKVDSGVYFVPAFGGLGAPYWAPNAKAAIIGMSFDTDRKDIVKAALESIAYQITDVVCELESESGVHIDRIRVDGKPTENSLLMQFQADISGKELIKNGVEEASAYGAAIMGGLAVGFWKLDEIDTLIRQRESIKPHMSEQKRRVLLDGWHDAVRRSIG